MSKYVLHPGAAEDLNEIWDYIAQDSLDSADRVIRNIYKAIQSLIATPNIGHRRPDLTSSPLRFWRIYDYLIAYAPDEYPMLIVAIIHGHRNPRVIAQILRGRQ